MRGFAMSPGSGRMNRLLVVVAFLAVAGTAAAIDAEGAFDDPELNARYRDLIHEIRCMKCQNQSIADSPIDVAADLRRQVREMMAAGQSDAEIKSYLSSRYGDFILYQPPLKPTTWALWGGPVALLVLGTFVFARVLKSYAAQPIEPDEES
jgi:cytochrome c-type biogenesis protein CcmH